eukprot:scaffold261152_cov19-Tisochrysis_lutea.AAC.2
MHRQHECTCTRARMLHNADRLAHGFVGLLHPPTAIEGCTVSGDHSRFITADYEMRLTAVSTLCIAWPLCPVANVPSLLTDHPAVWERAALRIKI